MTIILLFISMWELLMLYCNGFSVWRGKNGLGKREIRQTKIWSNFDRRKPMQIEDIAPTRIVTNYIPSVGLENQWATFGNMKPLSCFEYEMLFLKFPTMKKAVSLSAWPDDREVSKWEKRIIKDAYNATQVIYTEESVDEELRKFRKIILSLEKYRINDPVTMAKKYIALLKSCLSVPDCWGGAAHALEYAGLNFKQQSILVPYNATVMTIDTFTLWSEALTKLLDIEYQDQQQQSANNNSSTNSTWDQRFFSQTSISEMGALTIHDLLIHLVRLTVQIAFSREEVQMVCLQNPATQFIHQKYRSLQRYIPAERSIQLAMMLDHPPAKAAATAAVEPRDEQLISRTLLRSIIEQRREQRQRQKRGRLLLDVKTMSKKEAEEERETDELDQWALQGSLLIVHRSTTTKK